RCHQVEERGLTRAARPHERHEFSLGDIEADVAQRRDRLLALAIVLGDVANFEECHAVPHFFPGVGVRVIRSDPEAAPRVDTPNVASSPVTRIRSPSRRPSRPEAIILSLAFNPSTAITRSPTAGPSLMARRRATPDAWSAIQTMLPPSADSTSARGTRNRGVVLLRVLSAAPGGARNVTWTSMSGLSVGGGDLMATLT